MFSIINQPKDITRVLVMILRRELNVIMKHEFNYYTWCSLEAYLVKNKRFKKRGKEAGIKNQETRRFTLSSGSIKTAVTFRCISLD
jgi:hypothetical protein